MTPAQEAAHWLARMRRSAEQRVQAERRRTKKAMSRPYLLSSKVAFEVGRRMSK